MKIERETVTNKLHDALSNKSQHSFWKIWRNKFNNHAKPSPIIDGQSNDSAIANQFADFFPEACSVNSIDKNTAAEVKFKHRLLNYSGEELDDSRLLVDVEFVDELIRSLKLGKAVGSDNISAEHLKYSHPVVICILVKLFNLMLHFNQVPDVFGVGLTVPIPKVTSHKIHLNTSDFRGITISPIISKLFEQCLLKRMNDYMASSDLQCCFKKDHGCNHAIYTVQSTIEFFTKSDSTVNICALDVSKAFDKVNHYILFMKLMECATQSHSFIRRLVF